jgi:hypothetical protein
MVATGRHPVHKIDVRNCITSDKSDPGRYLGLGMTRNALWMMAGDQPGGAVPAPTLGMSLKGALTFILNRAAEVG